MLDIREAAAGVEKHARKMGLLPVSWSQAGDKLLIGRPHSPSDPTKAHALLVRSVHLPDGMRYAAPEPPT